MHTCSPFCILCGHPCSDPDKFRVADAEDIQQLLLLHCQSTEFHYKSIMNIPPSSRSAVCLPCVHWKRRILKKKNGCSPEHTASKILTPLDSIIMYAISPGHFTEPDHRCFLRLARICCDPLNGYFSTIPDVVRVVLKADSEDDMEMTILRTWWDRNARTSFFRFPETAKAVRHSLLHFDPLQSVCRRRWRR